jgi:Uma2 family endonuclease
MTNAVMAKPESSFSKLTYEDYVLFPDDGRRHEIIDGDHAVTPAPKTKHQRVSGRLFAALNEWSRARKAGEVFAAPCDVILSDENVVQPDLLFVSQKRSAIVTEDNIRGAPDLIVEIVSETTRKRDEQTKRKLYERYGVREYWIVDPEHETVKVFRRKEQVYARPVEFGKGKTATLSTDLLPEFRLSLSEFFS